MSQLTTVVYYRQGKLRPKLNLLGTFTVRQSSDMAIQPKSMAQQIKEGVDVLKRGGVVAFPTDTLYGLGAAVSSAQGIQKVFSIKGRSASQALPVLIASADQLGEVAVEVTPQARSLAERFWPGALTLILKKADGVSLAVTAGGGSVGIRVPDHPVPMALIRGLGEPITGTSANLSGLPACKTAGEVRGQLGSLVDYVVDAGPLPGGTESTIIDMTGSVPKILRVGAVSRADIERTCLEAASPKRR